MKDILTNDQISEFRLTKISLHGIGSYLEPTSLDISPFTVLCGKNGTGKSTWIKSLKLLQKSFDGGLLPFSITSNYPEIGVFQGSAGLTNSFVLSPYFSIVSRDPAGEHIDNVSALLRNKKTLEKSDDLSFIEAGYSNHPNKTFCEYGYPGSIGLSGVYQHNPNKNDQTTASEDYFNSGILHNNDRIRIIATFPKSIETNSDKEEVVSNYHRSIPHVFSLFINDLEVICFIKKPKDDHFSLYLNDRIFLKHAATRDVSSINIPLYYNPRENSAGTDFHIIDLAIKNVNSILSIIFDSIFCIGAFRTDSVKPVSQSLTETITKRRFVGEMGELSFLLYENNILNDYTLVCPPYSGYFNQSFCTSDGNSIVYRPPSGEPVDFSDVLIYVIALLGNKASLRLHSFNRLQLDINNNKAEQIIWKRLSSDLQMRILEWNKALLNDNKSADSLELKLFRETILKQFRLELNTLLDADDLYDNNAWNDIFVSVEILDKNRSNQTEFEMQIYDPETIEKLDNDPQDVLIHETLLLYNVFRREIDLLTKRKEIDKKFVYEDKRRFNRILIDSALFLPVGLFEEYLPMHAGMLSFKTFISTWLPYLLEIETSEPGDWSRERKRNIYTHWLKKDRGLIGYIKNFKDGELGGVQLHVNGMDFYSRKISDFSNPFTEDCQVFKPEQFSTGFKQVFPLLIQLGLMKSGELFCIENPESHLHPNLQLRITEYLLSQAAIGKCIILETHSDLIVRRTLRAILEEAVYEDGTCKISQNDAVIWFSEIADLKKRGFNSQAQQRR